MAADNEITPFPGIDALARGSGRVAIIGDTQRTSRLEFWWRANDRAQAALLEALAASRPDAILNVGDLVTWGPSKAQWRHFERVHAPIRQAAIPYLPVLGNHDLMPWAPRRLAPFRARFPALASQRWYAFAHHGLGVIALDSNFASLGRVGRDTQQAWLADTLGRFDEDPGVRCVIALWHHSPFTNSRVVRPNAESRRRFLPMLLAARKTRAVFTGHCHAYEHFTAQGCHFFVTGGGGGPLQPLWRGKRRRFEDHFSWPGRHRFLHYCQVSVEGEALRVEVVKLGDDHGPATVDVVSCEA